MWIIVYLFLYVVLPIAIAWAVALRLEKRRVTSEPLVAGWGVFLAILYLVLTHVLGVWSLAHFLTLPTLGVGVMAVVLFLVVEGSYDSTNTHIQEAEEYARRLS